MLLSSRIHVVVAAMVGHLQMMNLIRLHGKTWIAICVCLQSCTLRISILPYLLFIASRICVVASNRRNNSLRHSNILGAKYFLYVLRARVMGCLVAVTRSCALSV